MRQTKDIDDAVNDIVMVVVHQQKKRTILYSIHSTYFYLCLLRRVQAGYVMFLGDATSLYLMVVSFLFCGDTTYVGRTVS